MLTGALFLGLSGSGGGNVSMYNKALPAMLERMHRLMCLKGYTNNAISAPKLAEF